MKKSDPITTDNESIRKPYLIRMGFAIAVGIGIGVIILDSVAVGICIGVAVGIAIRAIARESKKE